MEIRKMMKINIMYREIDVTLLYDIIKIELYIHLSCFDKRS